MVWVGALTGLRWSEVAGLTVGCLDVDAGTLTVRRQIARGGAFAPPKSRAGNRTLAIPHGLAALLARHIRDLGHDTDGPDALVFRSPRGAPLHYGAWRARVWQPAVERVGLHRVTFHDLRRTNATILVAERVDVKTAQNLLGHADLWTTLAIYARASRGRP